MSILKRDVIFGEFMQNITFPLSRDCVLRDVIGMGEAGERGWVTLTTRDVKSARGIDGGSCSLDVGAKYKKEIRKNRDSLFFLFIK